MKTITVRWNKNSRHGDFYFGHDVYKCDDISFNQHCVFLSIGKKRKYIPYTSFAEMDIE